MTDDQRAMIDMWEWIQGLGLDQDTKRTLIKFMFRPMLDTDST